MVNYQNGKIYCLRSHQTDDIYIGSTAEERLSARMSKHRANYNRWLNGKHNYISSYEILKYDDCYIELLEDYPCENKHQLCRKEGEYIRKMNCVNKLIAGRTIEECYKDNRQVRIEYQKEYIKNNKVKHDKYQKEYRSKDETKQYFKHYQKTKGRIKVKCECGIIVCKYSLPVHKKTKKHIDYMNSQKK